MLRFFSLLLVILPIALIQWRSVDAPRIAIHHFPAGTLTKREPPLSKDWTWDVPEGWSVEPPQSMRLATYKIPVAESYLELAVSELPGPAGGLLSNVNRWRGQLGLSTISEDQLNRCVADLPVSGQGARIVTIPTPGETVDGEDAMVVALLESPRMTTFFKLGGPASLVASYREAFLGFISSLHRRHPEGSIR